MKRYKLLKDLPFAKAGDIFKGELECGTTVLFPEDYENYKHKLSSDEFWDFSEWFEEIKEYYVINSVFGDVLKINGSSYSDLQIKNMRELGVLFNTWLEADRKFAYLKAKEVIKQDTKGFKPEWGDTSEGYYFGVWDYEENEPYADSYMNMGVQSIKFRTGEEIEESFKKHPKEWKTYLTYDQ